LKKFFEAIRNFIQESPKQGAPFFFSGFQWICVAVENVTMLKLDI
jgi:hypothetical protein